MSFPVGLVVDAIKSREVANAMAKVRPIAGLRRLRLPKSVILLFGMSEVRF